MFIRKILFVTVPAMVVVGLLLGAVVEVAVRLKWDSRKGTPGFFVHDAIRQQRLASGYSGWFAGVPVRINRLELRDDREYSLEKTPRTFRILVLGDSVTFGHGSVWQHTYPYLLEGGLKAWRPDIDWQVWNAAVPGYNTSQELAHLLEVGPAFKPDLVIVGFFENDVTDNRPLKPPTALARFESALTAAVQPHIYSLELYKKAILQVAWRMSASDAYRLRYEHLATEESLLARVEDAQTLLEQRLTPVDRWSDEQAKQITCPMGEKSSQAVIAALTSPPDWPAWLDAVNGFARLNRDATYRVVFFFNVLPQICHPDISSAIFDPDGDVFYDGGSSRVNDLFMQAVSQRGLQAISVYDEFLHRRPSQMPFARGHALGNSNRVKADVLLAFLKRSVVPGLLPPMPR